MKWQNIIGNEKAKNFFQKVLSNQQRPHAFLVVGNAGIGKKQLAKMFAFTALCNKNIEPCGVCPSCIRLRQNSHPDYFFIEPELKKDSSVKKDSISISQIRFLNKETAYPPKLAENKVVIIDGIDLLTLEASNSLLKLLEEPPTGWIFILLAQSIDKIITTILSRVIVVKMQPLQKSEIINQIKKEDYSLEQIEIAVDLSDGSLGKTLDYLSEDAKLTKEKALLFLQIAFSNDYLKLVDLVEKIEREQSMLVCEFIATFIRDAWQLKCGRKNSIWNKDKQKEITEIFAKFDVKELKLTLQSTQQTWTALKNSANVRLAMEGLYINLSDV